MTPYMRATFSRVAVSFPPQTIVWTDPPQGETPLKNLEVVDGKVVAIRRGCSSFIEKALHAQQAGATLVIIVNSEEGVFEMTADDGRILNIPVIMVSNAAGKLLRSDAIVATDGCPLLHAALYLKLSDNVVLEILRQESMVHLRCPFLK